MINETTSSNGGPIIAIPAEVAHLWRGTLPPLHVKVPENWEWGNGDIVCDYDRACDDIKDRYDFGYDEFGWLLIEKTKALVFTLEQKIIFIPEKSGGIIADACDNINELIKTIPPDKWKLYPQKLELKDGRLFIFDSAFEGYEDPKKIYADNDVIVAQLSPGTYNIFHFNTQDKIGLVRLEKEK